jgi:hypothetical protein
LGRSTSAVTSSSKASSSMGFGTAAHLGGSRASWRAISALRSAKLAITAPSRPGFRRSCRRLSAPPATRGFKAVALRAVLPAFRPSACTGTTVLPCSATRPCAGRTKLTLLQPGSAQPDSSW